MGSVARIHRSGAHLGSRAEPAVWPTEGEASLPPDRARRLGSSLVSGAGACSGAAGAGQARVRARVRRGAGAGSGARLGCGNRLAHAQPGRDSLVGLSGVGLVADQPQGIAADQLQGQVAAIADAIAQDRAASASSQGHGEMEGGQERVAGREGRRPGGDLGPTDCGRRRGAGAGGAPLPAPYGRLLRTAGPPRARLAASLRRPLRPRANRRLDRGGLGLGYGLDFKLGFGFGFGRLRLGLERRLEGAASGGFGSGRNLDFPGLGSHRLGLNCGLDQGPPRPRTGSTATAASPGSGGTGSGSTAARPAALRPHRLDRLCRPTGAALAAAGSTATPARQGRFGPPSPARARPGPLLAGPTAACRRVDGRFGHGRRCHLRRAV